MASTLALYISEQNVRRMNSIIRGSNIAYLIITREEAHFIADSMDYFKCVSMPVSDINTEIFFEIKSEVLQMITSKCVLKITDNAGVLTLEYFPVINEKNIEELPAKVWEKTFRVNSLTKFQMNIYLNIINARNQRMFQTEALTKLDDLVLACSATEMGINFYKGQALTQNNNLKIFQELIDSDLSFSLQANSLKELANFKLDCNASIINNYIVFTRSNYTLAIKKCIVDETGIIPAMYVSNDLASIKFSTYLHVLLPELSTVTTKKITDDSYCKFNLAKSRVEMYIDGITSIYFIPCSITYVSDLFKRNKVSGFKINLVDLKPLQKLFSKCKEHEILVYEKNVKFNLKNSSALIRCELIRGE